jgi:hypothetical protein
MMLCPHRQTVAVFGSIGGISKISKHKAPGARVVYSVTRNLTLARGTDGSAGIRFKRPQGTTIGPSEVREVLPNSEAERSGLLRAGDFFFAIDGRGVSNLDDKEIASLFRGAPSTTYTLSLCARLQPRQLKGICDVCRKPVFNDHERTKNDRGTYVHLHCVSCVHFKLMIKEVRNLPLIAAGDAAQQGGGELTLFAFVRIGNCEAKTVAFSAISTACVWLPTLLFSEHVFGICANRQ